jgi:hypothetical protein
VLEGIIEKVEIPELGSHWKGLSLLGVEEPAHNKSVIFIVVTVLIGIYDHGLITRSHTP